MDSEVAAGGILSPNDGILAWYVELVAHRWQLLGGTERFEVSSPSSVLWALVIAILTKHAHRRTPPAKSPAEDISRTVHCVQSEIPLFPRQMKKYFKPPTQTSPCEPWVLPNVTSEFASSSPPLPDP